jgi:hypothetical protein
MQTVKIPRAALLDKLRANRDQHRDVFLEALEGYRTYLVKELERRLDEVKNGMKVDHLIRIDEPQDHTKDYDRVIQMAEMSVDDIIELNARDFAQFVMDEWGWKQEFIATAGTYTDTGKFSNYR